MTSPSVLPLAPPDRVAAVTLLPVAVPGGALAVPEPWSWAAADVAAAVLLGAVGVEDRFVYLTVGDRSATERATAALADLRTDRLRPAAEHLRFDVEPPAGDTTATSVLVSISDRAYDAPDAVTNPALGLWWPNRPNWPADTPEPMSLAEVHDNQAEFAAGLAPVAGQPVRFVPGANTSGGSQVTGDAGGFVVVPALGVMGVDCTDTALLAAELAAAVRPGMAVLDLTTGSGVNAVTAALAGAAVTANDIDPVAAASATSNAARNDVAVTVTTGSLFEAVEGRFDVIFGNPPFVAAHPDPDALVHNGGGWRAFVGDVYDAMFAGAREHLAPGGYLLVVCAEWGDMDDYLGSAARHRWAGEALRTRLSRDGRRRYRLDRWTPAAAPKPS